MAPSEAPEIIIRNAAFEPRTLRLRTPETVSIGRAVDCTIPIRDRFLSRRHAEIRPSEDGWVVRDCDSANGTWLNGERIREARRLRDGDRVKLGDTEIIFSIQPSTDRLIAIGNVSTRPTISMPLSEALASEADTSGVLTGKSIERLLTLTTLAGDLISDHPAGQLFGYILDRVLEHLDASRAALALGDEQGEFELNEVRRRASDDHSELTISRTLLREVMHEKKAVSYVDVAESEKLSQAHSIAIQGIRSIICAPLVANERVAGVLYVDWILKKTPISEEDVRLVAQIAQFAAMKLETSRLREEAMAKRLMDEELKTAYAVQMSLLPETSPKVEGFTLYGRQYPCRTVGGDYFDFVVRPDGHVYFIIADVSGKGITAALLMAGLQSAFRIFIRANPDPASLVGELNEAMIVTTPVSRFVTLVAGLLDPQSGWIEFANAGHVAPLLLSSDPRELGETDLVVGIRSGIRYRNQKVRLSPGESLLLCTDGLSEVESPNGSPFDVRSLLTFSAEWSGRSAKDIGEKVEDIVTAFAAGMPFTDDLTMVTIARSADGGGSRQAGIEHVSEN